MYWIYFHILIQENWKYHQFKTVSIIFTFPLVPITPINSVDPWSVCLVGPIIRNRRPRGKVVATKNSRNKVTPVYLKTINGRIRFSVSIYNASSPEPLMVTISIWAGISTRMVWMCSYLPSGVDLLSIIKRILNYNNKNDNLPVYVNRTQVSGVLAELRASGQPLSILIASSWYCSTYLQCCDLLSQHKLLIPQLPNAYSALHIQH